MTYGDDLPHLSAISRAVALALARGAIAGFSQFSVGADASLRVQTPEKTVVRGLHRGIGFGEDKLAFPAQRRAEVRAIGVEAIGFGARSLGDHAAPPEAALRMARFTATRAS